MAAPKKRKAPVKSTRKGANDNAAAPMSGSKAPYAKRPVWQGHLRLSLVSCPVVLINATSRANDISFHLLNPETNNRIRMVPTDPETGPVERSDLVKGYEIAKDEYVILTPGELDDVKLETTHTLDIESFVDAGEIDRLYWNDPYYLIPNGESAIDAYLVIRDAMKAAHRIALGRVVMHTRERLMAIEARGNGLTATTLRMADEVVDSETIFRDIPDLKTDRKMIDIAQKIIEQKDSDFAPGNFTDRYEDALRDLIQSKEKGEKRISAPQPADTNVIDLMAALRDSLKKKAAPKAPAKPAKPAARSRAPKRKTAR